MTTREKLTPEGMAFGGPRIRVAWNIVGCGAGAGDWHPARMREMVEDWARNGQTLYGPGTHWLEEEPVTVSQPPPDNERERAG